MNAYNEIKAGPTPEEDIQKTKNDFRAQRRLDRAFRKTAPSRFELHINRLNRYKKLSYATDAFSALQPLYSFFLFALSIVGAILKTLFQMVSVFWTPLRRVLESGGTLRRAFPEIRLPRQAERSDFTWKTFFVLAGFAPLVWFAWLKAAEPYFAQAMTVHGESEPIQNALRNMACRKSAWVMAEGEVLGLMRTEGLKDCEDQPYSAPFPKETALRLSEMVTFAEGTVSRGTILTVSPVDVFRASIYQLELYLTGKAREEETPNCIAGRKSTFLDCRGTGTSTTTFEAISQDYNGSGLLWKISGTWNAMVLFSTVGGTDATAHARLIVDHRELIKVGPYLLGGAIAAQYFWPGQDLRSLHTGQACLLAAPWGVFVIDSSTVFARKRLAHVKHVARKCAREFSLDEIEYEEAIGIIDAWEPPQRGVRVLSTEQRILFGDAMPLARYSGAKQGILNTTIRPEIQEEAENKIADLITGWEQQLPAGVCFAASCATEVDFAIAVAEIKNEELPIVASVSDRHGLLHGDLYSDDTGALKPSAVDYTLGSQSKIAISLQARAEGASELCNQTHGSLKNSSSWNPPVSQCRLSDGFGYVSIADGLAPSDNLPFRSAADAFTDGLDQLHDLLEWPGEWVGSTETVLGIGRSPSIAAMMTMVAAAERANLGDPAKSAGLRIWDDAPALHAVDLPTWGYDDRAIQLWATDLRAPIERSNGTLYQLQLNLRSVGIDAGIGKSGSMSRSKPGAYGRGATATFKTSDDRTYVIGGILKNADQSKPLTGLGYAQLFSLMTAVATSVEAAGST